MPKLDGYKTKEKILDVAQRLFAERGFNGISIDRIAKAAGVNKGLIYYHFKDKKDIIVTIFKGIIDEIHQNVSLSVPKEDSEPDEQEPHRKIKDEIAYCQKHKNIIAVMLMEALKADGNADFLFKCAEMVIQQELDGIPKQKTGVDAPVSVDRTHFLLHEFFTGFVPIIAFVALQEKWCAYFDCDKHKALEYFIASFTETHLKGHLATE